MKSWPLGRAPGVRVVSCAAAVRIFVDWPPESMTRYLAGRVVAGLVTLFIFATILFFLAEILIPGDFVTQFTFGMNSEQLAELRAQLGLDPPRPERYVEYIGGMASTPAVWW